MVTGAVQSVLPDADVTVNSIPRPDRKENIFDQIRAVVGTSIYPMYFCGAPTPEPSAMSAPLVVTGTWLRSSAQDGAVVNGGAWIRERMELNAPLAVTKSACYFVVRCLTDPDAPASGGAFAPVCVRAPEGCLVNARPPAAVANIMLSGRKSLWVRQRGPSRAAA